MKKLMVLLTGSLFFLSACDKCEDEVVCTTEFRMITLQVKSASNHQIALDSFYTTRVSNNQRIYPQPPVGTQGYVVLDDSYHGQLKNQEDDFRFTGWKNNQLVVNQLYRVGGDRCHIFKKSGADSVVVN